VVEKRERAIPRAREIARQRETGTGTAAAARCKGVEN